MNGDGVIDVFDLTRLREHIRKANPLPQSLTPFADLTNDGFVNEDDAAALIQVIVGRDPAKSLPLASIREISPFAGESSVALTREIILRFTMPLALDATLTTWDFNTQTPGTFYAEGGGRKLLTRVELSGDRLKATLFFLEPVPASTRVTVTFNGAGINDLLSRAIDPEGDGNPGGVFTYTYDTAPITPVIGTGIIGHVYASEKGPDGKDVPLPGVLVSVVGSETLFTHTASDGSFSLNPCPAGRFFVEVDGRTSSLSNFPDGGYYPYINKPWEALSGRADNLAAGTGVIYLPLVPAQTLQPVSATEETKVAFAPSVVAANPSLAGVEVYVPPNSLFADDGTRGGKVGLAPVASDRLPEPLPPGLNHALDISIQTDGATNFDRPVPVRFPNLPDRVTGIKLPPGAKSALWSYNHDKGAWEIAGPMTVTADGNFLVTDAGVGVRQPGWHGAMPGTQFDPEQPEGFNGLTPYPVIIDKLSRDLEKVRGKYGETLAAQKLTIAQLTAEAAARGESWAQPGAFAHYLFESWYGGSPVEQPAVPAGFTHFLSELLPSFYNYPGVISDNDHNQFLTKAVRPAFDRLAEQGIVTKPEAFLYKNLAHGGAFTLREMVQVTEPVYLDYIKPAAQTVFDAAKNWTHQAVAKLDKAIDDVISLPPEEKSQPWSNKGPGRPRAVETAVTTDPPHLELVFDQTTGAVNGTLTYKVFKVLGQQREDITNQIPRANFRCELPASFFSIPKPGTIEVSNLPPGLMSYVYPLVLAVSYDNLDTAGLVKLVNPDTDGDLIPDFAERALARDPLVFEELLSDFDKDGLPDAFEFALASDPAVFDSDHDGLSDAFEFGEGSWTGTAWRSQLSATGTIFCLLTSVADNSVLRWSFTPNSRDVPPILQSESIYRIQFYQASAHLVGKTYFRSAVSGQLTKLPEAVLRPDLLSPATDGDGDGLSDIAEQVIGTSAVLSDTDGDGISDGVEVEQGTDPLDERPATTGVINSVQTPGLAKDIVAQNAIALLADSTEGVSVFNVINALKPVRTAQIRPGGSTESVALDGKLAAATGSSLSMLDLSDLSNVRVTKQLLLGGTPRAVAAAGGIAYAGLDNGQLVAIDMATGMELERVKVSGEPLHDLSFAGDVLYVRSTSHVYAIEFAPAGMTVAGGAPVSSGSSGRQRLFAGGGLVYAPFDQGYSILSLINPLQPVVTQTVFTQQRGWREMVPTGSGLGVAAMGLNPGGDADVHLYDLNPGGFGSQFLTTFVTPGVAEAVSIYNGLAYVADGDAGLTVVNYKAYDALGVPPTISITTSFTATGGNLQAEEGKLGRVTAAVSDDVQVRNVEFYIDGQLAVVDGNFPFEHRFITPLLAPGKTSFTLRAKATDTGGNATWSETLTVTLVADATPPRVLRFAPPNGALTGSLRTLSAVFSEPINPSTLTGESFSLVGAGPDGVFNTTDDTAPASGALTYRETSHSAFLSFASDLTPGLYRLTVRAPLADLAGNAFVLPAQAQIRVFAFADRDSDGVPDDVEPLLGLDPDNPDTNGNGVRDGLEDFDHDGLVNAGEIYIGTDPRNPDSNNNGIPDGLEDPDADGLNNAREFEAGTDPNKADTDGDGWNDETEVTGGSSPTDPRSRPIGKIVGAPSVSVVRIGDLSAGLLANGSVVAQPPVFVMRAESDPTSLNGSLGSASFVATPTVFTSRQFSGTDGSGEGTASVIARPLVYITRYDQPGGSDSWSSGTIQAQPSITLLRQTSDPNSGLGGASFIATPQLTTLRLEISGLFFSQPPVTIEIQNE